MPEPVRIDGLEELRRVLRQVALDAPKIAEKAIRDQLNTSGLARINQETPRGETGKLASRNRVEVLGGLGGAGVAIVNSLPYANAIHWGRVYWPNEHSEQRRVAPIKARPFIYDVVEEQRPELLADLARAFEHALQTPGHT